PGDSSDSETPTSRPSAEGSLGADLLEIAEDRVQLVLVDLQRFLLDPEFLLDHQVNDALAVEQDDRHGTLLDRGFHRPPGEITRREEQALLILPLDRPTELVHLGPGDAPFPSLALERDRHPGQTDLEHAVPIYPPVLGDLRHSYLDKSISNEQLSSE